MKISEKGIRLIKDLEGFRGAPYLDGGGVPTIGYGATHYLDNKRVTLGDKFISEKEAALLLRRMIPVYEREVQNLVKVPLNQNQYDAVVSFVYNIGGDQFLKSTFLKKLNSEDYSGAANEFPKWKFDNGNIVQGLVNRRKIEQDLFLKEITKEEKVEMLEGKKTMVGMFIMLASGLLAAFGINLGIDWTGLEAAIGVVVGAVVNIYGYFTTKRGAV